MARVLPQPGGVALTCEQGRFYIPFEYASRGWTNDVRFALMSADGPRAREVRARLIA